AVLPMPTLTLTGQTFALDGTTCVSPIAPGASCTFGVDFHPVALGTSFAGVTAATGALTADVELRGRGTTQLSVVRQGDGGGCASGPAGLGCGSICTATLATTPVTITAAPDSGSRFVTWGGDAAGCGANPTCSLDVPGQGLAVAATFADLPTLTVIVENNP